MLQVQALPLDGLRVQHSLYGDATRPCLHARGTPCIISIVMYLTHPLNVPGPFAGASHEAQQAQSPGLSPDRTP